MTQQRKNLPRRWPRALAAFLGNLQGFGMYHWVYWTGVTMFVAWTALSAFSAIHGL